MIFSLLRWGVQRLKPIHRQFGPVAWHLMPAGMQRKFQRPVFAMRPDPPPERAVGDKAISAIFGAAVFGVPLGDRLENIALLDFSIADGATLQRHGLVAPAMSVEELYRTCTIGWMRPPEPPPRPGRKPRPVKGPSRRGNW